jgi:hypothetical protein
MFNGSLCSPRSLFVLAGMLLVSSTVPHAVADPIAPSYIYGIGDNNLIWEIDPVGQTSRSVFNTGLTGQSNAFAFDTVRDQMFFVDANKDLYYWNHATTIERVATAAQLGVSGTTSQPWNAAFYSDSFWFFNTESDQLNKVALSYSGTGSTTPGFDSLTTYSITGIPFNTNPGDRNRFGDIAIICSGANAGMLYAATAWPTNTDGLFYSLNLNTLTTTGSATVIKGSGVPNGSGNPNLQLSFNGDYGTLYGHDYNGGTWYTVDLASGNLTSIAGFTTYTSGTVGFRDLGGSSLQAVPAAVPEIDAGLCGGAVALVLGAFGCLERRRLRRPSRSAHG